MCKKTIVRKVPEELTFNGYNLKHNFGHGKKYLSAVLLTFNLLAFLFHTVLDLMDSKYRQIRQEFPNRKTFFDDIRALTLPVPFDRKYRS